MTTKTKRKTTKRNTLNELRKRLIALQGVATRSVHLRNDRLLEGYWQGRAAGLKDASDMLRDLMNQETKR